MSSDNGKEQTPEEAFNQFLRDAIESQEEDSDLRPKDASPIYLFNLLRTCLGNVVNTHPFSDNELFAIALSGMVGIRHWLINAITENRLDEEIPWRAEMKRELGEQDGVVLDMTGKPINKKH